MKYKDEDTFFEVIAGLWATGLALLYALYRFLFRKKP